MTERLLQSTAKEFFRALLRQACDEQKVLPSETAEFYLVQLLERFVRPEEGLLDRPLALDFLESLEVDPPERYQRLKHVGDTALFVSGVFTESLESTAVGPEYSPSSFVKSRIRLGSKSLRMTMLATPSAAFSGVL